VFLSSAEPYFSKAPLSTRYLRIYCNIDRFIFRHLFHPPLVKFLIQGEILKFNLLKKPSLVGIDIKASEIRLVQLKKARRGYQVNALAVKSFPCEVFWEGKVQEWGRLSDSLTELVENLDLKGQAAAVCLPANLIRMQPISLPQGLSPEEIEAEIYAYLQPDLFSKNESLCIDFHPFLVNKNTDNDIFFAATRQEYLAQYTACINASGLLVKIVDVDIYALKRAITYCLPKTDKSQLQAMIYVANESALLMVSNQHCILYHEHWDIDKHIDFESQLKSKIHISLNAFSSVPIEKLIVCDSRENLKNKISFINSININPFTPMHFASHVDQAHALSCSTDFLIACGLAMREVPAW